MSLWEIRDPNFEGIFELFFLNFFAVGGKFLFCVWCVQLHWAGAISSACYGVQACKQDMAL